MKTTTNGVTIALRSAGMRPGLDLKVTRRDPEHVRVMRSAAVSEAREAFILQRASKILELSGYDVEPGAQPWYLIVTKKEKP